MVFGGLFTPLSLKTGDIGAQNGFVWTGERWLD